MNAPFETTRLRKHVRQLGDTLGDVIRASAGETLFNKVEEIRQTSKDAQDTGDFAELHTLLRSLDDDTILLIAKAFSQFLNLTNIAEQHHTTTVETSEQFSAAATMQRAVSRLQETHTPRSIADGMDSLHIDLVLTAHPTEITRRTLIHKFAEINRCLGNLDRSLLNPVESTSVTDRLADLISQIWHTEEFRESRPSPVDEARWGFAVIENSLWDAVPAFQRDVDALCSRCQLRPRQLDWKPVQISSWIGGDRDGNPNVTADVTRQVILLAQWQACDLLIRDLSLLQEELSLATATPQIFEEAGHAREPYRAIIRRLKDKVANQRSTLQAAINQHQPSPVALTLEELLEPLKRCHESLLAVGIPTVANGQLLDTMRRLRCFGPHLITLDIRQESSRHTAALSELTQHLQLGDYASWNEQQRLEWLQAELDNPRPLLPENWQCSPEVREVINTFYEIARTPRAALGCYVISMAGASSDVLAVQLLLKATGGHLDIPVAPLFETLDDLNCAPGVIGTQGYRATLTFVAASNYDDFVTFADLVHFERPLENFRRQRHDLHEALATQFTRDGAKDACADGLQLGVEQHCRVAVELDQGAVWTANTFGGAHNNSAVHLTFFDATTGRGFLDTDFDDITDAGVTALRAAQHLDAHDRLCTRVVSNTESRLRLNHLI